MWDSRYDTSDYVYGTEPNTFLRENLTQLPKGRILCLAEGEGRNAVFLAGQGYQVTAVDASAVGLRKAEKLAERHGVAIEVIHADLAAFELGDRCWQGIVSIFCHLPPSLRRRLHRQVVSALAPGGVLLLEAYTPAQIPLGTGGPADPEMMMSAPGLQRELPGLVLTHLKECRRPVLEGKGHTGDGEVVQVIARRP